MTIAGKTALITGAAGDIGQATAQRFVDADVRLALVDRDASRLREVCASYDPAPLDVTADVTSEASLEGAAQTVRHAFEHLDILFVNAGVEQSPAPVADLTKAEFERVSNVNLMGAFLTVKHFSPLIADGGSIVLTSSIAAFMGFPALSAYSASKAGLVGFMRSISAEVAPRGIRCNTVHPGSVRSTMLGRSAMAAGGADADTEAFFATLANMAKLGRLVEPDEVAALVIFLAGDDSKMITGQSITVDGGTAG